MLRTVDVSSVPADYDGRTALHLAAAAGHAETVRRAFIRDLGLYTILPSLVLHRVWHEKGGSAGGAYIAQ